MPEPKNITICNIDEEGRFGGPERRIVLIAEGLAKHDVRTLILIPKMDSQDFESQINCRGLWYAKLNYSRLTLESRMLLRYIIMFPIDLVATIIFLRSRHIDLVHVNGSYQFRSAIAAFIALRKLVWTRERRKNALVGEGNFPTDSTENLRWIRLLISLSATVLLSREASAGE